MLKRANWRFNMTTVNRFERLEQIKNELTTREAMQELQRREAAEQEAAARAVATSINEARRLMGEVHQQLEAEAAPLYQEAHEWLLSDEGSVTRIFQIAAELERIESGVNSHIDRASRLAQRSPVQLVKEVRAAAGLPETRDTVPAGASAAARVLWRALALGLIGQRGVGHPNLHGFMQLG
jgi:hypothetical protein